MISWFPSSEACDGFVFMDGDADRDDAERLLRERGVWQHRDAVHDVRVPAVLQRLDQRGPGLRLLEVARQLDRLVLRLGLHVEHADARVGDELVPHLGDDVRGRRRLADEAERARGDEREQQEREHDATGLIVVFMTWQR